MKKIFLLIFFLSNCSNNKKISYYDKGINFEKQIALLVNKKFELFLKGYGLNTNLTSDNLGTNKIHDFDLSFGSLKKLNINEGRQLLVKCSEYILSLINNDKDIREYLKEFPFIYKNLTIHLSFYYKTGERLTDGHLTYCFLYKGKIVLCSLKEDYYAKEKIIETYEEALEKLKEKKL